MVSKTLYIFQKFSNKTQAFPRENTYSKFLLAIYNKTVNLFKELLEGKTAYSLRHTFATVCQQYVRPDIVDIWMGDSTTRLVGKVYTHFPDEFMLENMLKVQFTQA